MESDRATDFDTAPPGTTFGHFVVESRIGRGGGGVVYRATDRHTGASVALKMLLSATADNIALFKNEFRVAQGVNHPNVVQLGELFESDGQWFLSMEFVEGVDFITYVCEPTAGDVESRLRPAIGQLCSAVAALHQSRTVHRDIKPSNVMVTPEGRVVLLDMGLAVNQDQRFARDEGLTGTILYMAPEQAASEPVGPPADWYAVGGILFRALTGVCTFDGSGPEILTKKLTVDAPSPRTIKEGLPDDLVSLCEQLLQMDPQNRPSDDDVLRQLGLRSLRPSSVPRVPSVSLLGREAEMAWLRTAFEASRAPGPTAAILFGESGVGKSIVLRTFCERLDVSVPTLVSLFSRCYEREFIPFKAFDGAVEGLVEVLANVDAEELKGWLSPYAGLLPRIFPELGRVPVLAEQRETVRVDDPSQARRLAFDALRSLLRGLATTRPVLLLIDDVQWADADSIALLHALLEPPSPPPILIVCTLRIGSETALSGLAELQRLPGDVRTRQLSKLETAEAATFIGALLAHSKQAPLDAADILSLVAESDGHPMFLAELVFARTRDAQVQVPTPHAKLDDALRGRVRLLPSAAQQLLEAVCVAGIPTDQRLAADAGGVAGADLMRTVAHLSSERLVQTWVSGRKVLVQPYHDRVRESVVAALSAEQVAGWHGKLALALESATDPVAPEVLGDHWLKAGAGDRAKAYIVRAGEKADASFAFDRAAGFYTQAIGLCTTNEEALGLQKRLAAALTNANRWRDAALVRLSVADAVDPTEALQLRTVAAEQLLCSGSFDEGAEILRAVMRAVDVFAPASPWTTLLALLCARIALAVRGLKFRLQDKPLERDEAIRIDPLIAAGFGFAMTDSMLGSYFNTRALLRALGTGDADRLARTLFTEACFTSSGAHQTRARTLALIERLREPASRLDGPLAEALLTGPVGYFHYFLHDWPKAKSNLLHAARLFGEQCVGQVWAQTTMRTLGFKAMTFLGEPAELEALLAKALREMEQVGDLYGVSNLKAGPVAWLRLVHDEVSTSEAELREVELLLPKSRFVLQTYYHMCAVAQLDIYRGKPAAAHERMEARWRGLRRSLLLRAVAVRVIALDTRARSALAYATTLPAAAREQRLRQAEQIATLLAKENFACTDGYAALLRAGVAVVRGRREDSARHARDAEVAFTAAAMKLHVGASLWLGATQLGDREAAEAGVTEARQLFLDQGIANPARFVTMLAPAIGPPLVASSLQAGAEAVA